AFPHAVIGHRTIVFSAFLHYFVGTPLSQIITIFSTIFYFALTSGGLIHSWQKLSSCLVGWLV
ncbi:MAG: hypothetical protein LBE12_16590, partial [Planctomycetaceae bacterium]|nr:hypothetical protein [Planctomycetaceae bacterium]